MVPCEGDCAPTFGKCAGSMFETASRCCTSGDVCQVKNESYAQCVPANRFQDNLQLSDWDGSVMACMDSLPGSYGTYGAPSLIPWSWSTNNIPSVPFSLPDRLQRLVHRGILAAWIPITPKRAGSQSLKMQHSDAAQVD